MVSAPSPPTMLFPASNTGGWQPVNVIVIHSAVMELFCGAARDLSDWATTGGTGLSWHYSIDNCECYQNTWDNTVAWHDGMNYGHVGIEMCETPSWDLSRWDAAEHEALLRNVADLVRQLCLFYDVPMVTLTRAQVDAGERGICGHNDIPRRYTTHWDPGAFPWERFMGMVRNEEDDVSYQQAYDAVRDYMETDNRNSRVIGSDVQMSLMDAIMDTNRFSFRAWIIASKLRGDDTDEQAIVQAVLDGLSAETIADAIPESLASDVADELTRRLAE